MGTENFRVEPEYIQKSEWLLKEIEKLKHFLEVIFQYSIILLKEVLKKKWKRFVTLKQRTNNLNDFYIILNVETFEKFFESTGTKF